jgi:hypothetical protein
MQTFSKEGIMVNKIQRGMNVEEMYLQEDLLPPNIKEGSINFGFFVCIGICCQDHSFN